MKIYRLALWIFGSLLFGAFILFGYSWVYRLGLLAVAIPLLISVSILRVYGCRWVVWVCALIVLYFGLFAVGVYRPINDPRSRVEADGRQISYLYDSLYQIRNATGQWPPNIEEARARIRSYQHPSGFGELDLSQEGIILWLTKRSARRFDTKNVSDYLYFKDYVNGCGMKGIILMTAPNHLYGNAVNVITRDGVSKTIGMSAWARDEVLLEAIRRCEPGQPWCDPERGTIRRDR